MTDRAVSVGCLVAYGLWAAAAVMVVASIFVPHLGMPSVLVVGAAMTATVRCYFVKQNQLVRNAFELGRDSASSEGRVSSIR